MFSFFLICDLVNLKQYETLAKPSNIWSLNSTKRMYSHFLSKNMKSTTCIPWRASTKMSCNNACPKNNTKRKKYGSVLPWLWTTIRNRTLKEQARQERKGRKMRKTTESEKETSVLNVGEKGEEIDGLPHCCDRLKS